MKTNSPDIQALDFSVLMDISLAVPAVTIENLSTHSNAAALDWVFEIYSPSGTLMHAGNFDAPDVDGDWAVPFVNTAFPRPNNQIEWGDYKVTVKVKDSAGTIFTLTKNIKVCRPGGNTKDSKNTYGKAFSNIITKCATAQLWVEDKTPYTYQGVVGLTVSKIFRLIFPADETGISPAPFVAESFSSVLIPIAQSGAGYQYYQVSVMDYDLGDNVTVRVKYYDHDALKIQCNIDLTPIACELRKLIEEVEAGNCKDSTAASEKIKMVSAHLHIATLGIMYPQAGIDPYAEVDKINEITGWECDCCGTGVNAMGAVVQFEGYDSLFDVNIEGGDITGGFTIVGNTIQLNLKDFSYIFKICDAYTGGAFSVTPTVAGQTKTFCLNINETLLATNLLTAIQNDGNLLNQLNQMVVVGVSNLKLTVDGGCVLATGKTCDYTFESVALGATDKVMITAIELDNGTVKSVNQVYDQTNDAVIEAALNGLGIGAFDVALVATKLTITSADNASGIKSVKYYTIVGGVNGALKDAVATKDCEAGTEYPIGTIIQAIITYLCDNILARVKTGEAVNISCLSAVGGVITTKTVDSNATAIALIKEFVTCYNGLVEIVKNIKQSTCDDLKAIFANTTPSVPLTTGDMLYGTRNGACSGVTYKEIASRVFTIAKQDQAVKDLLCAANTACGQAVCAAVTNATAAYDADLLKITGNITNTGALKYRVAYRVLTTTGGGLSGIPLTFALMGTIEVDAVAGVTTPYELTGVAAGVYTVVVVAICASGESAPYEIETAPCSAIGSFNVTETVSGFDIDWADVPAGAEKVRLEVVYPNGGSFKQNYDVAPAAVSIVKPAGVYGTFAFKLLTVCDESAAWYSTSNTVEVVVATPSSCPNVTDLDIVDIDETGATFNALKPTLGTVPNSYTLQIIPMNGGATRSYNLSSMTPALQWVISDLMPNTGYYFQVLSICAHGVSSPVYGGSFKTLVMGGATNGTITNNTLNVATSVTLQVNGTVIFAGGAMAAGGSVPVQLGDYGSSTVRLTPCDAGATAATITIDGTVYNFTTLQGETFVFDNIPLSASLITAIEFS